MKYTETQLKRFKEMKLTLDNYNYGLAQGKKVDKPNFSHEEMDAYSLYSGQKLKESLKGSESLI